MTIRVHTTVGRRKKQNRRAIRQWPAAGALAVSMALTARADSAAGYDGVPDPRIVLIRRLAAPQTPGLLTRAGTGLSAAGSEPARKPAIALLPTSRETADDPPELRFDIQPGLLEEVLERFQAVTRCTAKLATESLRSIQSPGVIGTFTVARALEELLNGTGVTYRPVSPDSVILELLGPESSVQVTAAAASLSSPKQTQPLVTTPKTVTIISQAMMQDQGATTLRDVLQNVPGLTIIAGEGGTPAGDNLTLRGFSARNDLYVDGVRDLGPQSRDPFNLEQVEITKGPDSVFSGRGSTGGTINLVSKSPLPNRFHAGTLELGSAGTGRVTADVNLPLSRSAAFRLNLLGHSAGVTGRNVVENRRWGVAPTLTLGAGSASRYTFAFFHLQQKNISDYGIPWVPANHNILVEYRDRPAPVPRDTFYGIRDRDTERMGSNLGTFRFERDIRDGFTLRNQLRYGRSTRDSVATAPRFTGPDSLDLNREYKAWITEDTVWDNQSDLNARFGTGRIGHSLVTGLALTREANLRRTRTGTNMPTPLFHPNPDDIYTGTITTGLIAGDVSATTVGVYAFDTARLGRKWEISGGVRWDRFDAEGVSTAGSSLARVDRMLSLRAGAVYKPRPNGSIYASYGTSLNPSLEGLAYQTGNVAIDPEKTYSVEAGSKWDLLRSRILLSGAVFRVDKTNARTPGLLPDDPPQVLQGEQMVKGIELGVTGTVTRNWQVFTAYTFLDTEIVESNVLAELGKELPQTPRNSASIWTSYRLFRRVTAGAGIRFVGRRFSNTLNTRRADSYRLADAMVSFPVTDWASVQLNIYNLANSYYFERLGGGHLIPGAARSATITLRYGF